MTDPLGLVSQPQFVGSIFITICLLGAIAGVRPSSFSRSVSRKSIQEEDSQKPEVPQEIPALRGHHYSCDEFSDHVLRIDNNVFCAGCTGLTTGAVISILGSLVYFFLGVSFLDELLVFWVGLSGVFLGLVQHQIYRLLSIRSGFFRFVLNVIFVVGAFLVLVGANRITGDLTVDIYILCVILLWIITRILMSKSEHERICKRCDDETCSHPLC
ncbi:MAG: UbiA family prenyltransferase [Candidatus Thorarchaeota archaeon]